MIRPRPAEIDRVALAVESDEAFNPLDVRRARSGWFVRRVLNWDRSRRESGVSSQCFGESF